MHCPHCFITAHICCVWAGSDIPGMVSHGPSFPLVGWILYSTGIPSPTMYRFQACFLSYGTMYMCRCVHNPHVNFIHPSPWVWYSEVLSHVSYLQVFKLWSASDLLPRVHPFYPKAAWKSPWRGLGWQSLGTTDPCCALLCRCSCSVWD